MNKKVFYIPLLALLSSYVCAEQTTIDSRLIESYSKAKAKERVKPKYPMKAAKKGRDGWVQLSYVIDEQGRVKDVVSLHNGGDDAFVRAAISAVEQWQFEPAMKDGKAIEQCDNSVQLNFVLSKGGIVSRKFQKLLRKGQAALDNDELGEAKQILSDMDSGESLNITELFWRNYLAVSYYTKVGDKKRRYNALIKARSSMESINVKRSSKKELLNFLLQEEFIYEASNGLFSRALHTFDEIVEEAPEIAASLQPTADKIEQMIAGDEPITVIGEINNSGRWSHDLARRSFVVNNIDGRLDKLEVRCSRKFRSFTVSDKTQWKIPEPWGDCNIHLLGQEQSQFSLVELN